MIRLVFIFLLLCGSIFGQTPIDYRKWSLGDGKTRHQIGGPPQNYKTADAWAQIENDWITIGDTLHTNRRALLKTDVNNAGQIFTSIIMGNDTVTIAQRLLSLKWFRKSDSAWLNIDNTPNWGTPSVIDNQIKWNNVFPGVNVTVGKYEGQVDYALHFKPAFLDSAVVLYNQRTDSADIYLANVIAVELVGVSDAGSSLGTIKKRILKKFGKHILDFGGNYLEYPKGRDDPHIRIHQRHVIRNGKLYMLELVKMSDLKWAHETYPAATLWHRASTNIETPDVEDALTREGDGFRNFGGSTTLAVFGSTNTLWQPLIRCLDLNNELGSGYTVTNCSLITQSTSHFTNGNVAVKRLWKHNWEEGTGTGTVLTEGVEVGATGNNWANSTSDVWGTEWGARCEKDNGSENTSNDGPCNPGNSDRKISSEGNINYTGTGRYAFDITALAQADANDSINIILVPDGTVDLSIGATENGTAGNRPFFVFITSGAGGSALPTRKRRIIQGLGFLNDDIGRETICADLSF